MKPIIIYFGVLACLLLLGVIVAICSYLRFMGY